MKHKLLVLTLVLFVLLLLVSAALFLQSRSAAVEPPQGEAIAAVKETPEPTPPPTPEPTPVPTPAPQGAAAQLTLSLTAPQAASAAVLDGNLYTDYTFEGGTTLTLSADDEISALYVIFGTYPGNWTLRSGGAEQPCGQDGFLHECVFLERPDASIELVFPDGDVMIRDLYAFSDGYLPTFVQTWHNISEDEGADILLFSTHYDDELLFFGGLIPYYSAVRGLRVQVAYMTSNYLSDFSNYRFRPHEALDGLWTAYTHFYPVTNEVPDRECYGYLDAQRIYGEDQFTEFQVEQIRRFKPLVVVTQAENGEYGHGAHVLTSLSVERAVEAAADPEQFPESAARYGVWDTPKTYLHLYGDWSESTMLNYEIISQQLGLRSPFQVAQEAYRQHITQQQWVGFYVYSYDHPFDSHRFGLYRSLVGPDAEKDDLMEHVSREAFPIP